MKRPIIYTIMAALLLAVVAIFFFYPDAVQGRVLQQHDISQGIANGQEGKLFHEQTGETTRWTNALFGGMPTYQINPSYPANDLLGWVVKVYTLSLPSPANLLFGMMIGFFIMILCMKGRWPAALFGAVAWGLSTYFIIIIGAGHIWKFLTLMFIPPTIGGIALCYRGKYVSGTAIAALFGALQLMSNHVQMSYYFMAVILALMIAWLCIAIQKHAMKRWGLASACVVVAGIIAVAANSSSLYNTYAYSKETTRTKPTLITEPGQPASSGPDMEYITAWSYGVDETATLLIPNVKGGASVKPEGGQMNGLTLAQTPQAEELYNAGRVSPQEMQLLAQLPQYFGDQPMTNGPVYVGALVLVLAVLALLLVNGPMKWALFGVSILAVLLSWGHNFMWLTETFVNYMPGYAKFRTPASILVIVEFTLPLLAVMMLRQMVKNREQLKEKKYVVYSVFGVAFLICLIGWMAPGMFGSAFTTNEIEQLSPLFSDAQYANVLRAITDVRMGMVSADCLRSLLFILLGFGVVLLYMNGVLKQGWMLITGCTVVVFIDLFSVNLRYVNSDNFTEPMEQTESFVMTNADRAILRDKSNYRVMDTKDFMGARSSYFYKTIGGYHAAKLTRYQDLITHQFAGEEGPNPEVINMLNGKYILAGDQYQVNPDALGNAWFVSHITYVNGANAEMKSLDTLHTAVNAVADRSFGKILGKAVRPAPEDTIYETSYAPNALTYKAVSKNGGVAVFSEVFFPWGWEATIDGKPAEIGRVNYVLRAMRIPAGSHEIAMRFDPQSSRTTDTISTIGCIVILVLCAGALVLTAIALRRKKESTDSEK